MHRLSLVTCLLAILSSGFVTAACAEVRQAQPLSAVEERALKVKSAFKECDTCPEMIVMPAGSFVMGSPDSEPARESEEGPQHQVTIPRNFALARFAVTFDEWDSCVAGGGCNGYSPADNGWGRGRMPVINVSWDDARSYAAWLASVTGKAYRLPSEAEREYATRAGTKTPFWMGARVSTDQANFYFDSARFGLTVKGENREQTLPVESFRPNPWGLYQMHGNIQEWAEDCWHGTYSGAPQDGSAWTSGGDCKSRVLRGGCWACDPGLLRSASRTERPIAHRNENAGFRIARTLLP